MINRPGARPVRYPVGRDVPPFYVLEVLQAAQAMQDAGRPVLHLEVGQPCTGAPRTVLDAANRAVASERLGYTTANGIAPLRLRIAAHYAQRYGVTVDPERIVLTAGASGGFVLAFLAAFPAGARVAVTEPGYPCYRNTLLAFERVAVGVPVDATSRFQPTPQILDAAGPLDGLVMASPSNPTGTALTEAELQALVNWSAERGVRLVADEIYHGISYSSAAPTALSFSDDVIVLNSFSKYFSMTGWRLGWMVLPTDLVEVVDRLAGNLYICPATLSQHAALAAFDAAEELDDHVRRYGRNREIVLEALPAMGITELSPADGAFYVYARTSHLARDSAALCEAWLEELAVAVTPGIDFDPTRGAEFVRFSFSGATADIAEAMGRIGAWVAAHPTGLLS